MKLKEAVILAGGKGTRLQSVISDLPKPIAPVGGRAFLSYQFDYLIREGISHVTLSVCHLHEKIESLFGTHYGPLSISYAIEKEALGTGGAIAYALDFCRESQVVVLNGDTYFPCPLKPLLEQQLIEESSVTLALRKVAEASRYGTVNLQGSKVVGFTEKGHSGPGLINAGCYLIQKNALQELNLPSIFSFEKEVLPLLCQKSKVGGLALDSYFIDMGIPADYARAQVECADWKLS